MKVILMDANHCPGAVCILFHLSNGKVRYLCLHVPIGSHSLFNSVEINLVLSFLMCLISFIYCM